MFFSKNFPRQQHWAAIGLSKNGQPIGFTVVVHLRGMGCMQSILTKHNFSWTPCNLYKLPCHFVFQSFRFKYRIDQADPFFNLFEQIFSFSLSLSLSVAQK